jgi:hypothetical protein
MMLKKQTTKLHLVEFFQPQKLWQLIRLKIRDFSRLSPEKAHSKTYCTTIVQRILYNKSRGNARKIFENCLENALLAMKYL